MNNSMREAYLNKVTETAALKYLAHRSELKREIKRINIETGIICAGITVLFTLLILGVK